MRMIHREEFLEKVCSRDEVRIVDVLPRDHYLNEHIKGAICLPLDELEKRASMLLGRDDTIIVYCGGFSCLASTKAAEKLTAMGFRHVFDYKGGLEDAKKGDLPLEGQLHRGKTREFPCPARA